VGPAGVGTLRADRQARLGRRGRLRVPALVLGEVEAFERVLDAVPDLKQTSSTRFLGQVERAAGQRLTAVAPRLVQEDPAVDMTEQFACVAADRPLATVRAPSRRPLRAGAWTLFSPQRLVADAGIIATVTLTRASALDQLFCDQGQVSGVFR
jgi:hypothetical protein